MRAKPMPAEDRRQAIIAATTELVIANGPDLSTRQIADACGLAEGTLFRVFPSKRDILKAVVDQILDPGVLVEGIHKIPASLTVDQTLAAMVDVIDSASQRVRSVMIALHAAQDVEHHRPKGPGPGDHGRFKERQALLFGAMTTALTPHADALRISVEDATAFLQIVVFSNSMPQIHRVSDRSTLTDLLVHALVKEPS